MKFFKEMTPAQACLIGVMIALLLFFFSFGGLSKDKKMTSLKRQKKELAKKNKEADVLIEEAKAYKERLNSLGNTINKVIKYIPKDMSSAKMMRSLTDSAKVAGVSIIGVTETRRNRNKNDSELYEEVPVKIKLEGNFTQIMIFLSKLTELENIVTMKDFNIKSVKQLGEGIVSFDATFVGYKYKALASKGGR